MVESTGEVVTPLASIVIPTKDAGGVFARTLESIRRQELDAEFEVLVIDSGSSDSTVATARAKGAIVCEILPGEFDHGNTRNIGASMTRGRFIVFLSQDAVPNSDRWLHHLLDSLRRDEKVAGAYSRVIPHPDADPLTARLVTSDINYRDERIVQESPDKEAYARLGPHDKRLMINFNDVASAVRREVWLRLPLPKSEFGEDLLWGKGAIEAGYKIVFENRSVVQHSHEYDAKTLAKRAWIDGRANRRILDRICIPHPWNAVRTAWRVSREDRGEFSAQGFEGAELRKLARRAFRTRWIQMWNLWRGGRLPSSLVPTPVEVTKSRLKILFVVHGFPPQTRAGTEVYTLNLAKELQKRHDVVIVHRYEDSAAENYSVSRLTEVEGLPVYRIVNNLNFQGIQETFNNRYVEERFRQIIDTIRPDIVHFQHCLHMSVSLIDVVRERDVPSFLTLHDYWFICPKVQLIQTSGKVCGETQPGIGCVRCAANKTPMVRLGKIATFVFYPVLLVFLRFYPWLVARARFFERRLILDLLALFRRRRTILGFLRTLDLMISPSPFLKEKYLRFGVPADRIILSRNGLDTGGLMLIEKTSSRVIRFAFMGSFVWYKGLDVLISGFEAMTETRAELSVYGDDCSTPFVRDYKQKLVGLCKKTSLRFRGPFRTEELPRIYEETDALVVPSVWYENAPMVIFEAFAAGTPVIASRLGGMADFVSHEKNGLLFRPGDPADLARTLDRCVREPDLLERCRSRIPLVKSVQQNARELEIYYRQGIGRKRKSATFGSAELPVVDLSARRYHRKEGAVDHQGEEFVLLRPNGKEPSKLSYRIECSESGAYRIELQTILLEGELGVCLAGNLSINGQIAGRVPEHGYRAGEPLERLFSFSCVLRKGRNLVEIENDCGPVGEEGSRPYYLRLQRVRLFSDRSNPEEER